MIDISNLPCFLDDYELRTLLFDSGYSKTFLAFQTSIKREVLLTLIEPRNLMPEVVDSFIESAKAKAQVKCSYVCAVYEATKSENAAYYVQELPQGESLDRIILRGHSLMPLEIARILHHLAGAQAFYEENGLNVSSWMPEGVFVSEKGAARCLNQVEPGFRPEGVTQRDELLVGNYFMLLVPAGQPGSTRVATLCAWLRGEADAPRGMNWAMVRDVAETIVQQLDFAGMPTTTSCASGRPCLNRKTFRCLLGGVAAMFVIGVGLLVWKGCSGSSFFQKKPTVYRLSDKSEEVVDVKLGQGKEPKKISVDVHEVTIESYARFLNFMSKLSERELLRYRMPDQPARKTAHAPEGWEDMLMAAEANGEWKGHRISLDTPVTGVDYWDAVVYCKWAERRLPTSEEWRALAGDGDKPVPDPWGPVTMYRTDVTPGGIGGLSGGVAEWTSSLGINPAFPMAGEKWIICGGSFANGGNADTEDYVDEPETARPDLGFRTVKDI